ncbi:Nse4-domain-containing protein [Rhizodiscina lignyota]|uniref:Non-structural maintenance of chromosomes element 4 n=1 Tax=Rhizodiscina lignyota TaxID=1504668 RepID=A0A9P4IF45_9PEZI|nr:Nse4-domain-containing protein [Rhizodiscina lignyota]
MARLNKIHPSPSPSIRSSVYDGFVSATPDPTPRRSTQATLSPSPPASSDKENQETPDIASVRVNKGKAPMAPPPRPAMSEQRGTKRRRLEEQGSRSQSVVSERAQDTRTEDSESRYDGDESREFYDPEQDDDERRRVRTRMRDNIRNFHERKDELFAGGNDEIIDMVKKSNDNMKKVRQTADATIDSRFLVHVSEFALRKARAAGDNSAGIDLDNFVSKCVSFMRNGGRPRRSAESSNEADEEDEEVRPTQRRRTSHQRRQADSDDEAGDENGDALPWHILGARACFPSNKRPPVPSFLLGPLSVQKRARAQTQRTQRTARNAPEQPVARPQQLRTEDLATQENNNLTALCGKIRKRLQDIEDDGVALVEEALEQDKSEEEIIELCKKVHLGRGAELQPGIPLFEFAINPNSFGQSVENLFYVAFLIKDGHAAIFADENGLPLVRAVREQRTVEQQRADKVTKRQAIISLDYPRWQQLIELFDIKEPLIPHRESENSED